MTAKAEFEIPIVLPEVESAADGCVERLLERLWWREGITNAHVKREADNGIPQLCVHFDPEAISLGQIRSAVLGAGAEITSQFGHVIWEVSGLTHARRARQIGERLRSTAGVLEAEANISGLVRAEFNRSEVSELELAELLQGLGATPIRRVSSSVPGSSHGPSDHVSDPPGRISEAQATTDHSGAQPFAQEHNKHDHVGADDHDHDHGGVFGAYTEVVFALLCGALLACGFTIQKLVPAAPDWLPLSFYIGAYGCGGFFTVREAVENLRQKRFEIDTLMLVAAAGAAALGAWAEGALLLFLFSIGHALEHYAMGRAKRAIAALAELAPKTATVRRPDGSMSEVPVEELVIGDTVLVKPDERLPADGFVTKGMSAIDQAPVTGESIPVDKRPVEDAAQARAAPDRIDAAHRVFAGTINGGAAIEIEVTRLSGQSTLAKVVQMVSEAETQKSPTQRFTDKFERYFVPVVLALAVMLLFAWVVVDEPFRASFYRAMAVLVAASPCALAIATPSAVLSGVARAARGGVLIKGGAPLELLGSLDAIAFDKTGTLTIGEPHIREVKPAPGIAPDELMAIAVAVETSSDHPLAQAIARDGKEYLDGRALPDVTDVKSLTGRGVSASVGGEVILIGKAEMFGADGIAPLSPAMVDAIEALRQGGHTTMVVRRGEQDLGAIGLMDTPRPAAKQALNQLRVLGIRRMIMISGDHQRVAEAVAREVGLDEARGDLMPEDKVTTIKQLRAEQKVAMVGDGVNDAPAMATATVGIAMGAAGSDVALETADVALMADDLAHLPFVVGLSRRTRAVIRQNVFVSLGVVIVLVPATIFGLGIGPAVAMHEGSTVLVVFNALRLLAYRDVSKSGHAGA